MAQLLIDLLAAGLIEKLDGDDERFVKMERAAETVAKELHASPQKLIGAILAGLDPDVPANDPAIAQAQRALVAEWKSMSSVHTSTPVSLLRAILLDACVQAGEGVNAAILWLTAADTLPLVHLGKEETSVRRALEILAVRTEDVALAVPKMPANERQTAPQVAVPASVAGTAPPKVNRETLLLRIAATAGPNYKSQQVPNPNPHSTRQPQEWAWEFADRMNAVLADELDALAANVGKNQSEAMKQFHASQAELIKAVTTALTQQQQWLQGALITSEARKQAEQLRLNALWWFEALYSRSLRCSYRELTPSLAAVVMAIDLLNEVSIPSPASVGYLLAEAVHRLPAAAFDQRPPLSKTLGALREARGRLPKGWLVGLGPAVVEGRLSLRDLIVLALGDREWDVTEAMRRAGLSEDAAVSLSALAQALFRQEQAVRIAARAQ
ncbi:GTPase-associated system all-helical protein GASH [Hyalangium sp.]|uniref:GTPase-associated system all-helical protein GASH n=1 Tax=Hyalangium sp. TaxID=2028555 RepID=UPI002D42B761|nr:GTPase-associated system all-helical protein GASH [Hyalangium sp.]HYH96085.1 GTPase-associated system all-helical protein GASH [Hyalangium sp.]